MVAAESDQATDFEIIVFLSTQLKSIVFDGRNLKHIS
jgi:hypothetical protein